MDELSTILESILQTDLKVNEKISSISNILESVVVRQGKGIKTVKELEPIFEALIRSNQNSNKGIKDVVAEMRNLIKKEIPVLNTKNLEKSIDDIKSLIQESKNDKINVDKIEKLLYNIAEKKQETIDLSPVTQELKKVIKTIEKIEIPEIPEIITPVDNSEILRQISLKISDALKITNRKHEKEVIKFLEKISKQRSLTGFVGGGGGSTELVNKLMEQINPATDEKLDDIIAQLKTDFFMETAFGNIPGITRIAFGGTNEDINSGQNEFIGSLGGGYNTAGRYLTANTLLYFSSTNTDDDQLWVASGLWEDDDGNWVDVVRFGALDGNNQVVLNAEMIRVPQIINIDSTDSDGEVWLAESDDLTGGIPNTTSKQKIKAIAGRQTGTNALATIPSNKIAYFSQLEGSVGESNDALIYVWLRAFGGVFGNPFPFPIYQQPFDFFDLIGFQLTEKFDIEFTCETQDASAMAMVIGTILLKDA